MNDKNLPDRLWDDVSGTLILILFPYLSQRPEYFKVKMAWSEKSMI